MSAHSLKAQAATVQDFLQRQPDSTIHQITAELRRVHGEHFSYPHMVIYTLRNKVGDQVIVRRFDKALRAHVYKCASNRNEARAYELVRKDDIRSRTINVLGMVDRSEALFPGDPAYTYVRAALKSVVDMLSA